MKRERHYDTLRRTMRRGYWRSSPIKRNRRYAMMLIVLFSLFAAVGVTLVVRLSAYHSARQEYEAYRLEAAAETAVTEAPQATATPQTHMAVAATPKSTPKPFVSARVQSLLRENGDTIGWIDVPGTEVQYPVVQSKDNEYYLKRSFQKKRNVSGAIFLDCWNSYLLTDFNSVIYGHNMKDGSMFAFLRQYKKRAYADEHLIIEITLPKKKLVYQVFSAYTAEGADIDFRGQSCVSVEERSAFIRQIRNRSAIGSALPVSGEERLLTLATCTAGSNDWYYVVHAKLVEEVTTEGDAV